MIALTGTVGSLVEEWFLWSNSPVKQIESCNIKILPSLPNLKSSVKKRDELLLVGILSCHLKYHSIQFGGYICDEE